MKHLKQKFWYVIGAVPILLAICSFTAQAQVTFNLTDVGPGDPNLANIYTSPYQGNINGGPTIPVICDDFADDSYIPESWTAYANTLSSVQSESSPNTELRWVDNNSLTVDGYTLNQAQAYTVAALLSIDILQSGGSAQQDYGYALWGLFDYSDAFNQLNGYPDQATAQNYLSTALGQLCGNSTCTTSGSLNVNNLLSNYSVNIYSYSGGLNPNGATGCGGNCPTPPQEFITVGVSMPEPSTPMVLGMDVLGALGLILLARRKLLAASNLNRS